MNFKQDLFDYIKDLTGFSCLDGDLNEIYDICNKERINQDNISEKLHCENERLKMRLGLGHENLSLLFEMVAGQNKINNELKNRLEVSNQVMEDVGIIEFERYVKGLKPGVIESTNCVTEMLITVRDNKVVMGGI